ncbi:MAG: hypothetical protein AABY15_06655 [Nanoarchaeota archaeon]
MQKKLPLFDTETVEKHFELSFESKTKEQFGHKLVSRSVYIRRGQEGKVDRGFQVPNKKDYTFISISGLNFLGQRGSIDFRFITDTDDLPCNEDVCLPELNDLPKERLIEFVENVIQRIVDGEFEWDYANRKKIYSNKIHSNEAISI